MATGWVTHFYSDLTLSPHNSLSVFFDDFPPFLLVSAKR